MIILAILAALVVALSVASLLGLTADSRDPDYGVGPMIDPRRASERVVSLDRDQDRR